MRVIIAGSRHIDSMIILRDAIALAKERDGIEITEVISGCARGPDTLAIAWAFQNKIPVKKFPARWDDYGPKAGPIRNEEMAHFADAVIAIWDGTSHGTRDMIMRAKKRRLKVSIYQVLKENAMKIPLMKAGR